MGKTFNKIVLSEAFHIFIAMFLSFLFHFAVIHYFDCWMCTDTDGYWLHAATFTGHDWSGVASKLKHYYGWGYSAVLTIPFMFSNNIHTMYKIAIIINMFLCASIVPMAYSLLKKISPQIPEAGKLFMATCISLYSSYIFFGGVCLAETFIFFLTFLSLWLFYNYVDEDKTIWGILSAISVGYLYCVHNRNIGIVAAFLIIAIVRVFYEKRWKEVVISIFPMLVMLLLKSGVNHWLMLHEKTAGVYVYNTYGGVIHKMFQGTGLYSVLSFVENVIGECWYTMLGTFLIGGFGIYEIISKKLINVEKKRCRYRFFYAYSVLSWIMMIAVSSLFMVESEAGISGRIDVIFYGRYMENTIAFFILMGLVYLWEAKFDREKCKEIGLVFITSLVLSVATYHFVNTLGDGRMNWLSVIAIMTTAMYPNMKIDISDCSIFGLAVAILLVYLFYMKKGLYRYLSIFILTGAFLFVGYHATYSISRDFYGENPSPQNNPTYVPEFNDICNYILDSREEKLYILMDDPYEAFAYQLVMNEKTVISFTDEKELKNVPVGKLILVKADNEVNMSEYELEYENLIYRLYR